MREDEEKIPILGAPSSKRNTKAISKFDVDEKTTLNGIPDDFSDASGSTQGSSSGAAKRRSGGFALEAQVFGLSAGLLFLSSGCLVGLPVWLAGLVTHQSDPFVICFTLPTAALLLVLVVVLIMRRIKRGSTAEISLYPFFFKPITVYGLLTSLSLILHGFCGVPSRTPAYIQATSFIVVIPAACITKYAMTRIAYTVRQGLCLLAAMLAIVLVMFNLLSANQYIPGSAPRSHDRDMNPIFLMGEEVQNVTTALPTLAPTTAGNDSLLNSNVTTTQPTTLAPVTPNPLEDLGTVTSRTLWSLGFTLGYVLQGVAVVLLDEPIRVKNGNPMVVCLYAHLMTFLWVVFMFFFDLIPVFGMATYLSDFRHHLHHGVKCLFGADSGCGPLAWRGWLDILLYTTFSAVQCYLFAFSPGPIYPVLCAAAAVPLAAIAWLCLADTGVALLWYPSFTPLSTLVFLAIGLAVPAAIFYRHYCLKEQEKKFNEL